MQDQIKHVTFFREYGINNRERWVTNSISFFKVILNRAYGSLY